jgi:hypothetical protein
VLADQVRLEQELAELRASNARLLRELERAKASRDEVIEAVYRAIRDGVAAITVPPVPRPVADRRRSGDEVALIAFSDLQLAQTTRTYGSDVARERVERYAAKIERLVGLQRSAHPVRRAHVYLLGDIVEGELVFPGQAWQVDASAYVQVALAGPEIVAGFIRRMLALFEAVHVVAVPGNHGIVSRHHSPETNYDRMVYAICQQLLAGEKRLTWQIAHERGHFAGLAVDEIGPELSVLAWHGHQARRVSSSSHLPFYKLIQGWASGALPQRFNVSLCGHHHVPTLLTLNAVTHLINGTFASDAEYAVERFASNVRPAQWLLFARPDRGITAQYLVDLERD